MRPNRVLHSELVLNRRGNLAQRQFFQKMMNCIRISESGDYMLRQPLTDYDHGFKVAISLCKKFKDEGGSNYTISPGFLKELMKIDREIPLQFLPDSFLGYFAIPDGILCDESGSVRDIYVFAGDAKETPFKKCYEGKVFWMAYFTDWKNTSDERSLLTLMSFKIRNGKVIDLVHGISTLDSTKPIHEQVSVFDKNDGKSNPGVDIARTMLNAILYIHSEDPIIKRQLPQIDGMISIKKRAERKRAQQQEGVENPCSVPVIYVNYGFHGRTYSVDTTVVRTHPRWQPCGEERSRVKLIWVAEHVRNYKKNAEPVLAAG